MTAGQIEALAALITAIAAAAHSFGVGRIVRKQGQRLAAHLEKHRRTANGTEPKP